MRATRLHEYTEEMGNALLIDEIERPGPTQSDHVVVKIEGTDW